MPNLYRYTSILLITLFLTACGSPQPAEAATKAMSIQFLLSQVRTTAGPLAGGKVDFYAAGTTTRKTVWLDRNKATPAANPYTLDSNGTAAIFGDGLYRIVIKDSAGVTKYDRDNISIRDVSGNVYDVADYASLAAAVASIGSTPATLQFASGVTVPANLVIPATLELMSLNKAGIAVDSGKTITFSGHAENIPISGAGNVVFNGTANYASAAIANSGTITINGAFTAGAYHVFTGSTSAFGSVVANVIPEWFGAIAGDGLDDAPAILKMFNAVRGQTSSVMLDGAYDVSYGFYIPSNCTIDLKTSTVKSLPTFGQGTLPANTQAGAIFFIGQADQGIAGTIGNVVITGDGWTIDGNRANLTGSPAGASGIRIYTSYTVAQADLYKLKNVRVENGTIQNCYFYGSIISGAEDVIFSNVKYWNNDLIAACIVSGKRVKYNDCDFSGTTSVNNAVQGMGVWNEPNETWQDIQAEYNSCSARLNFGSGFLWWNNGADANVDIVASGCWSLQNSWDGAAYIVSASNAGFAVSDNATGLSPFKVVMNNNIAKNEYNSGFRLARGTTSPGGHQIIMNNCTAIGCNLRNGLSEYSSGVTIAAALGADGSAPTDIIINDLSVIAPINNTQGYGLGVLLSQNLYINNPFYRGTFTAQRSDRTMTGTAAYAGGTIAASNYALVSATVTGAVLGDFIQVSYDKSLSGCIASGYVQTNGTVYLKIDNNTAGNQTIAAGNFKFTVIPQ